MRASALLFFLVLLGLAPAPAEARRSVLTDGLYLVLRESDQVRALRPLAGDEFLALCKECSSGCLSGSRSYLVIHTRPEVPLSLAMPEAPMIAPPGPAVRNRYRSLDDSVGGRIPLHLHLESRCAAEMREFASAHLPQRAVILLAGRVVAVLDTWVITWDTLEASCCSQESARAIEEATRRPLPLYPRPKVW